MRQHGVFWSLDRAYSILQERLFDFRYGTDTVGFVQLKTLKIDSQHVNEGSDYQPTRMRLVRRLLSALNPLPGNAFVDFGCGKGRVLLLAAEYGFRRVTGVEFSTELCCIARDNISRYRSKKKLDADIRIVEGDAVEYEIQDDDNYIFMFNSFSAALVGKVIQNIQKSLVKKQRRIFVIYNNPLWNDLIIQQGFLPIMNYDQGGCIIYSNLV